MARRRLFGGVVALGVLVLIILIILGLRFGPALVAFPELPGAYEAKELCSCLFVEGRSQEECEGFIRQDVVTIDSRTYDLEGKRVTVEALYHRASARHVSPRYGCVIE